MTDHDLMGKDERALNTSELGTREYWESFYAQEIVSFEQNGDEGECWFGRALLKRIIAWIRRQTASEKLLITDSVLDIGCGNGLFLLQLASIGYERLFGLDYSPNAIHLARHLVRQNEYDRDFSSVITLNTCDLLDSAQWPNAFRSRSKVECVFDKGTYDAICLNPSDRHPLDELQHQYRLFIAHCLTDNGLFILTSCNWTRSELLLQFIDQPEIRLKLYDQIEQPTIQFGGRIGSTVTCLIFQRN